MPAPETQSNLEDVATKPRGPRPYEDAPRLPRSASAAASAANETSAEPSPVAVSSLVQGEFFEIEVGPGRGGFMFERAAAVPTAGLIGLEVRRKWATIVDQRLDKAGLGKRARVFAEDAKIALPRLSPDGAFRRAYLHFPDPWWKKRHSKRLVMGDVFLQQMVRLLEPGGELFVQTDVESRALEYEAQILTCADLIPAGDVPGSARMAENPYAARSPREHRAIKDGLPVHRLRFRKG